jgi:hypothetical protein
MSDDGSFFFNPELTCGDVTDVVCLDMYGRGSKFKRMASPVGMQTLSLGHVKEASHSQTQAAEPSYRCTERYIVTQETELEIQRERGSATVKTLIVRHVLNMSAGVSRHVCCYMHICPH